MAISAPLRVTVELRLLEGPASGQRRFRLCRAVELPPRLRFEAGLPLEGQARGEAAFSLPDGQALRGRALLTFDPEHPERGSEAELVDLDQEALAALQTYIEQRTQP